MVQIRSDQPVPLVFKGRPGHGQLHQQSHAHLHQHHDLHHHQQQHQHQHHMQTQHLRGPRPLKLSAPMYLKSPMWSKPGLRKPLKIKLSNSKPKSKPSDSYDKPFKYEKPTAVTYTPAAGGESQKLPLETHTNYISEHFAPIHTIPAPNLALHDNHIHHEETYLPPTPKPQPYHTTQSTSTATSYNNNQYQVIEDNTNDQTILDPFSGSQKLFAPDPDPSLPTSKIRPATESFNKPSNGKPLPSDVQSNYLPPAQPLVQILGPQQLKQAAAPEIYPIQFTQQAQLQPFITANIGAVQPAPIPIYNPTYLVTQSNNLYSQHKQQLFKPHAANLIAAGYVNADLTQEVASNGQILQAAKDPHNNIHPVLDSAPQFAALIAAPALGEELPFHHHQQANVAAAATGPEGGFVVSNFFGNAHDSSQLLQAYAEEEAQHQQLVAEQATLELQKQHHYQQLHEEQQQRQQQQAHEDQQQLLLQQQQNHLLELQQQHFEQQQQRQQQQQQQQQEQQLQQQLQQQQLQLQQQQQQLQQQQHQQHAAAVESAASAFHEHKRLVQQQLSDSPLRIFVPDEESADGQRIQKRSDNLKMGIVEDASANNDNAQDQDLFEVSTSVEVSNENQRDDASASLEDSSE